MPLFNPGKLILPFLLFILCGSCSVLRAQETTQLKITVISEQGELLSGVTVSFRSGGSSDKQASITNDKGVCILDNLKAGLKYELSFTHIGYEENTLHNYLVKQGERNSLLIRLKNGSSNLNEAVVIGYGERKKSDVTGALSEVKSSDIHDQVVTSFDQALAGKMAGVQVLQTTGEPGGNVSIRVRGTSSISAGENPLFVIDGFPVTQDVTTNSGVSPSSYQQPINPLATIDMNDIESIVVLKDAASEAIYGSRASNGVVLVTTKKGAPGKTRIGYSFNAGLQQVSKRVDMMNAYDYAKEAYDSHNNAYLDAVPGGSVTDPNSVRPNNPSEWVPPQVIPYVNNVHGLTNTDWQKAVFRQAMFQGHTISASGGTDKLNFYVSGNYLDQDGIIINNNFKRYSVRANVGGTVNKLKFGVNVSPSYTVNNRVESEGPWSSNISNPYGFPNGAGVVANALTYAPIFPVYNPDGTFADSVNEWGYGQTNILNPVAIATLTKDQIRNFRFIGSAYAERELFKGLTYKLYFGSDINTFLEDFFRPTTLPVQQGSLPSIAYGLTKTDQYLNWDLENTLNYHARIGPGNLTALLGYSSQKENQYHSYAAADNFPNNLVTTLNAGQPTAVYSDLEQWTLVSMLGRVQYDIRNKYFLAASLRRDGSSRFGLNNKWGWFPSASAGWNISKETFFDNLRSVISNLKVRGSYGVTGNFSIPNYASLAKLSQSNYILGSEALTGGLTVTSPANPALTWENTASLDAGVEIGFLKNALNVMVDYYDSKTTKLLLNVPTAGTTGFSTQLQNIGQLTNKGVEVAVSYHESLGRDWNVDLSGNIAFNKNNVTSLGPGNAPIIAVGGTASAYFITEVGKPIGNYYLLRQTGIYKSQEDLDTSAHFSNSHVGDFKFADVNHDGQLSTVTDRTIVGNFQPKYTFGLSPDVRYRDIDLAVVIQGTEGNKILDLFRRYDASSEGNFNNLNVMKGRYRSPTDIGVGYINRADRIATGNNGTISSWHVEDGSFERVKNITLGYNFKERLTRNYGIAAMRLYATVQNPFTLSHYSLFNPEISDRPNAPVSAGEDYGSYPLARTYALGLNMSF